MPNNLKNKKLLETAKVFNAKRKGFNSSNQKKNFNKKIALRKKKTEVDSKNCLEVFRKKAKQVSLIVRVFRRIRQLTFERRGMTYSGAMQLMDNVVQSAEGKDLLFDPNDYKSRYQFAIPSWARKTCAMLPEQRSELEILNMASLMRQLKIFRKYSSKMQLLLAKIVTYERFGRRRVVIRKGHIGRCFYLVFSGTVGVVIQGDEDRAFVNDEKPVNILRKGDAFGELALVRNTARSATIVCLENTEFLVIDKDDFLRLGVHKFSFEEMLERCNFMRSLEMFRTWSDEALKEVAEGGRHVELLCNNVVEVDTVLSEFVYFVKKGQLDVVRLLDLSVLNEEKCNYYCRSINNSPQFNTPNNSPCNSPNLLEKRQKTNNNKQSHLYQLSLHFTKNSNSPDLSGLNTNVSDLKNEDALKNNYMLSFKASSKNETVGLGTFIKVDSLNAGQIFGLNYILNEEHQNADCKRRFILVSAGCELIRIQKSLIKSKADQATLIKIKQRSIPYPSDVELNEIFLRYNSWRCFKENLVDRIIKYNQKMDVAKKNVSVQVPKYFSSKSISVDQYEWLQEEVSPLKASSNSSLNDASQSLPSSFSLKGKIFAPQSTHRTLMITHGGSRRKNIGNDMIDLLKKTKCLTT